MSRDIMLRNWRFHLLLLVVVAFSCQRYKDDVSFDDKIVILENSPESLLSQLDTSQVISIGNEREATNFLLRTLAYSYTAKDFRPDKEKLIKCMGIFESERKVQKQLETLYLLAGIYQKERNTEKELASIERAMRLAQEVGDPVWLFHLYSYLSDMYFRKYDMLRFVEYQVRARQIIQDLNQNDLDVHTLVLVGRSYLHTGQAEKAEQLLSDLKMKVGRHHIDYNDILRLLGVARYKLKNFENAVPELEASLEGETDTLNLFTAYSALALCEYQLEHLEKAHSYEEQAILYDLADRTNYTEIDFYKSCAGYASAEGKREKEADCMRKVIGKYEQMLQDLNSQTLDGAIQHYMHIQEQRQSDLKIHRYQFLFFGALLGLALMGMAYLYRKRKQALELLALQRRIDALKKLEEMQDESKALILRDIEVAKRIVVLKHTQKERSEKLMKELDKLELFKGNKLLATQWKEFYHHINLTFDNFQARLVARYPLLNEKEVQLCCLMVAGFRTEEIAAVWSQSVFTVHKCKTHVRKKIHAPEAADIVAFLKNALAETPE